MLESGKILQERYRIEKQIGQGGMGAVYVAVDQRFGSTVAIKETLFLGENFEKAFEREARLLNSLRHPALPNVRDYFSEEHNQYLVMEFIPGEDLSERLEKNGKAFAMGDVLDWSKQLLEALDFLHNQEIPVVHRDIKPQNLKLTPKGQIILLDFGLAKGNPTDASHLTNAKSIFGYSRSYASLEQMQGTGTDPRSDLYSLAATVYHLATGVPPVDALTRAMSVLSQKADPLVPADQVHEQVSKGIANILYNAMDLNAGERPASAREMLEMLNNSDRFEDLEHSKIAVSRAVPTAFLNQETRIFPADNPTYTAHNKAAYSTDGSELETEVNKNRYSSSNYKTNVVSESPFAGAKPKSRKSVYVIGAALSLILMAIGASALIYLNEDHPAESRRNFANPQTESAADSQTTTEIANAELANTNSTNPDAENAAEMPTAETVSKNAAKQPAGATVQQKNKATETAPTAKKTSPDKTEMVIVDPESGKVIFKGDTIETDQVIINDKGFVFKKPPIPPNTPDVKFEELSPEQLKRLTPKQIERLKQFNLDMERRRKAWELQKKANAAKPSPAPKPE